MHAVAPRQHRKVDKGDVNQPVADMHCRAFDGGKIQPFIGGEVEDHPVRHFHISAAARPAVELDRAHLHALQDAAPILDTKIIRDPAVLFGNRHMLHRIAEPADVVLQKSTSSPAPENSAQG